MKRNSWNLVRIFALMGVLSAVNLVGCELSNSNDEEESKFEAPQNSERVLAYSNYSIGEYSQEPELVEVSKDSLSYYFPNANTSDIEDSRCVLTRLSYYEGTDLFLTRLTYNEEDVLWTVNVITPAQGEECRMNTAIQPHHYLLCLSNDEIFLSDVTVDVIHDPTWTCES